MVQIVVDDSASESLLYRVERIERNNSNLSVPTLGFPPFRFLRDAVCAVIHQHSTFTDSVWGIGDDVAADVGKMCMLLGRECSLVHSMLDEGQLTWSNVPTFLEMETLAKAVGSFRSDSVSRNSNEACEVGGVFKGLFVGLRSKCNAFCIGGIGGGWPGK